MSATIRQLQIFNAVVENGQVTKAAQQLFLTQSAVSLALNEMENHLGGPLFDRSGRCLELNDRGRYFLPLSREILDKLEALNTLMNEKDGKFAGSLNLVASSTIGNYVLPYLITAFINMYPDVHINMLVYNTKTVKKLILDRTVDLGFVEGEVNNEQIVARDWFHDELVLISRPEKDANIQRVCDITTDLKNYKWVMREPGSGTAETFKSKLGKYVTNLNVVMELGNTEAIKKAVEAGAGIGCLSKLTVYRAISRGWLQEIPLLGVDTERQLSIIHHKNKAKTRLIHEFLDFCFLLTQCSKGNSCLSSPENFQKHILQFTEMKNRANA